MNGRLQGALVLAVVAGAFVLRHFLAAGADVSWYLTVVEKMLDGGRLYVDVLEPNPPMAIYLYVPAVWLARLVSVRPETMLDVMTIALALVTTVWSFRRLAPAIDESGALKPFLLPIALAVLIILPASTFAQREHIALILFVPWIVLAIMRATRLPVATWEMVFAGIAGGLVIAIKPHFALALAGASLSAATFTRSWRTVITVESFVAGLVFSLYFAIAFVLHPEYWRDTLPVLLMIYLPSRVPVALMVFGILPALGLQVLVVALWLAFSRRRSVLSPWLVVTVAASTGFLAAAIIQGKGWPYQFFPAFAPIAIALFSLGALTRAARRPDAIVLVVACTFCAEVWHVNTGGVDLGPLARSVSAISPHPRLMALASDIGVGFPLARDIDGVWVDRTMSRWLSLYAGDLKASRNLDPALLPKISAAEETDRRGFAADLRDHRPDALLVERKPMDFLKWGQNDSEIAFLLSHYHYAGRQEIGGNDADGTAQIIVEVWAASEASGKLVKADGAAVSGPAP